VTFLGMGFGAGVMATLGVLLLVQAWRGRRPRRSLSERLAPYVNRSQEDELASEAQDWLDGAGR
jgi:hypothetical protein